jgi:hypothetical protein
MRWQDDISQGRMKQRDDRGFVIRPELKEGSPLDVEGVDLGIATDRIMSFIQEGRRTQYDFPPSYERSED